MADNNRFIRNIRRIVGIDPNQTKLPVPKGKDSIPSRRGIGFRNSDGQTSVGLSGTPGQTSGSVPAQTYYNSGAYSNFLAGYNPGNVFNPTDPSKAVIGYNSGVFDVGAVIDNAPGTPTLSSSTGIGIGNNLNIVGGTQNGLTGLIDCATGQPMEVRFDGRFRPPEGWENAELPPMKPLEDQILAGQSWRARMSGTTVSAGTCVQAAGAFMATVGECRDAVLTSTFAGTLESSAVGSQVQNGLLGVCGIPAGLSGTLLETINVTTSEEPDAFNYQIYYERVGCVPGVGICPLNDDFREASVWPEDGKLQLAYINGRFVMSNFEPESERVAKYADGNHSQLDFCFGSGRKGSIIPTNDGGYILAETDGPGGPILGVAKRFDTQNKVVGEVTESTKLFYAPQTSL